MILEESNPGLAHRFSLEQAFRFSSYNLDELMAIFDLKLSEHQISATDSAKAVAREVLGRAHHRPKFGNGSTVEVMITEARVRYLRRHDETPDDEQEVMTLAPEDIDPEYTRYQSAPNRLAELFSDIVGHPDIYKQLLTYQKAGIEMRGRGEDPRAVIPTNFVFLGPPGAFPLPASPSATLHYLRYRKDDGCAQDGANLLRHGDTRLQ